MQQPKVCELLDVPLKASVEYGGRLILKELSLNGHRRFMQVAFNLKLFAVDLPESFGVFEVDGLVWIKLYLGGRERQVGWLSSRTK